MCLCFSPFRGTTGHSLLALLVPSLPLLFLLWAFSPPTFSAVVQKMLRLIHMRQNYFPSVLFLKGLSATLLCWRSHALCLSVKVLVTQATCGVDCAVNRLIPSNYLPLPSNHYVAGFRTPGLMFYLHLFSWFHSNPMMQFYSLGRGWMVPSVKLLELAEEQERKPSMLTSSGHS